MSHFRLLTFVMSILKTMAIMISLTIVEAVEARESRSCYSLSSLKLCIRKYSESRPSIAQLIPLIFPQLDQLVLHHVHPREFESLAHLAGLSRLSSLTVGGVGLQYISPVLELRGQQLRELRLLCYGGNNSKINLSLIGLTCPRLTSLTISGNCVTCEEPLPALPVLTNLQINTHAFIPSQVWSSLISHCHLLSSLEMTGCQGLWDESLATILDRHTAALARITRPVST